DNLPDVSQNDVDLLDTQPSGTPVQLDVPVSASEASGPEELFGKRSDPDFHQLEPAGRVAEAGAGAPDSGINRDPTAARDDMTTDGGPRRRITLSYIIRPCHAP